MIRKIVHIDKYWKVIVYYDIDYNFFNIIEDDLVAIGSPVEEICDIATTIKKDGLAFTVTNFNKHISITGFIKDDDIYNYLNSIVHEAEHIKQAILQEYDIEDKGEYSAYLVGYIFMKMIL